MRRRAFVDGAILIILAIVALAFLFYWAFRVSPPPAKAAPPPVVKPADPPPDQPAPPPSVER